MKKYSKVFSTAMAATLATSAIVAVTPANAEALTFKDDSDIDVWAKDSVYELVNQGAINGINQNDGTYFQPKKPIKRQDAAKIIAVALGYKEGKTEVKDPGFIDVPKGEYYSGPIAYIAEKGIIEGKGNNKFDPTGTLTRAEMAKIVAKAYGLQVISDTIVFKDIDNLKPWAKNSILALNSNYVYGTEQPVTDGKTKTEFKPNDAVTRQELATFVVRAQKVFPSNFAELKDSLVDTALERAEGATIGERLVVTSDKEKNEIVVTVNDTTITKAELSEVFDGVVDSFVGIGTKAALAFVEVSDEKYSQTNPDLEKLAKSVGKAMGIEDSVVGANIDFAGDFPVFKYLNKDSYEGTVNVVFKDGTTETVTLKLNITK